ncbi:MAG TPA: dTDP-4-dehydrorhamnose 3,5-epimerase [Planctomycetes bacterium]|nr:dTDP-4-dehydrorhamnose 3,5-epimerase [Planctomycetota bacterium]
MELEAGPIEGVVVFRRGVYGDERGEFSELWNRARLAAAGLEVDFVQDNFSRSEAGVLRGMHLQAPPFAQGKLVTVISGRAFDVGIDLREDSPTFGVQYALELSAAEGTSVYWPRGIAHGFLALSQVLLHYKCDAPYAPQAELTLAWDDARAGIAWPLEGTPKLSPKDREGTSWEDTLQAMREASQV